MSISSSRFLFWIAYFLTIFFCFFFFSHTDPIYTIGESLSYLNGHGKDFYDFNSQKIGDTPYLPTIYGIIALWNALLMSFTSFDPNKLQSWLLNTPGNKLGGHNYFIVITWYKCLLVLFSALTFFILRRIADLLPKNNLRIEILFITSPFVIFSVLIFSGYDIFSVFFTLLGVYFYLQKRILFFSIAFSIAITCKFFALAIFIPLLLLAEKNLYKIIFYSFMASVFCLIYYIFYMDNLSFLRNILMVVDNKINKAPLNASKITLFSSYILLCFYSFFKKNMSSNEWIKKAIFISYSSYVFLLLSVKWHPNWILIIIPFLLLTSSYIKNKKLFFYFEALAFLAFIGLCTNVWVDNVDQKMITQGPLSFLLPNSYDYKISDFFNIHALDNSGIHLKTILLLVLYSYFLYPLYEFILEEYEKNKRR